MAAVILAWNPDRWQDWDYQAAMEQVAETGQFLGRWPVPSHQNIPVGTDAWLLLQGVGGHSVGGQGVQGVQGRKFIGRGLIGHGKTRTGPHPDTSAAPDTTRVQDTARGQDISSLYVDVAFDAFLPFGEQLAPDLLREAAPGVPWESIQRPGYILDPADETRVRRLWSDFGPPPVADPTLPAPGTYPDEALSTVEVNRYERSPEARRACLAHHGTACAACGFSFEITYGEIGKDFIQVHHIVPVTQLGSGYVLDPVSDLVPLCANCHAMAHHGVSTPRTVAELRRIISAAGFMKGQQLTPSELEAQRDARKILGQP